MQNEFIFNRFEQLSISYGKFIGSLANLVRARTAIEIGVAFGTTSKYICNEIKEFNGILHGFDVWSNWGKNNSVEQYTTKNAVESYLVSNNINNFKMYQIDTKSSEFKELLTTLPEIDFAFIDGDHSYEGALSDFNLIYPKLSITGVIVFHDTFKINGLRKLMLDLRTSLYNGEYDIIDFPFGGNVPGSCERFGLSILSKRSYPFIFYTPIEEVFNPEISTQQVLQDERDWYNEQLRSCK